MNLSTDNPITCSSPPHTPPDHRPTWSPALLPITSHLATCPPGHLPTWPPGHLPQVSRTGSGRRPTTGWRPPARPSPGRMTWAGGTTSDRWAGWQVVGRWLTPVPRWWGGPAPPRVTGSSGPWRRAPPTTHSPGEISFTSAPGFISPPGFVNAPNIAGSSCGRRRTRGAGPASTR